MVLWHHSHTQASDAEARACSTILENSIHDTLQRQRSLLRADIDTVFDGCQSLHHGTVDYSGSTKGRYDAQPEFSGRMRWTRGECSTSRALRCDNQVGCEAEFWMRSYRLRLQPQINGVKDRGLRSDL